MTMTDDDDDDDDSIDRYVAILAQVGYILVNVANWLLLHKMCSVPEALLDGWWRRWFLLQMYIETGYQLLLCNLSWDGKAIG